MVLQEAEIQGFKVIYKDLGQIHPQGMLKYGSYTITFSIADEVLWDSMETIKLGNIIISKDHKEAWN